MSINNSQQISDIKLMLVKGNEGEGITSIEKTGTSGLVDTYTITFTDGKKTTFTVTNGKGIVSIAKTSTVGNVDTYTITYNDNTTSTFTVTNGTNASAVGYDNSTSELAANDVQEAIDELADEKIDTDAGTFEDESQNTYTGVTVDMISYDNTNNQLLLKVNGADTVLPFKKRGSKYVSGTGYGAKSIGFRPTHIFAIGWKSDGSTLQAIGAAYYDSFKSSSNTNIMGYYDSRTNAGVAQTGSTYISFTNINDDGFTIAGSMLSSRVYWCAFAIEAE